MTGSETAYGLVAEFDNPHDLVEAARRVREEGYQRFETYSPYPIKDLDEIVRGPNYVPLIVLICGFMGAAVAWSMQYYIAAIDYPINSNLIKSGYAIELHGDARLVGDDTADVTFKPAGANDTRS